MVLWLIPSPTEGRSVPFILGSLLWKDSSELHSSSIFKGMSHNTILYNFWNLDLSWYKFILLNRLCVCQSPKSKLFVLVNYRWILDFELSNGQFFRWYFNVTDILPILRIIFLVGLQFHHLWRKLSYRSLVRSSIESSVLATRGTCVFIFLLSVCNVLQLLECAVKFWHSACFILKIWDNFPTNNPQDN